MAPIMTIKDTTAATTDKMPADLESLHRDCFACGVCNRSGLNLHFDVGADGVATAVWQPSPAFRSYPDRVHGGVIATLLDSAIVHALFEKGVAGVTAELTIRYLQSVNVTNPVHVTGWVESNRHGVYLCCAEVHQDGLLAVRASAKFMAMPDVPKIQQVDWRCRRFRQLPSSRHSMRPDP
jgi:acyl-coenzyme A thioesterase PaaI-like protein